MKNEFSLQYKATIGADFLSKSIQKNDDTVQLQLWDTAGAEKYHSMGQSFYRNSEICILVFDITDSESFKNIESWRTEFLVGNKTDLEEQRVIQKEEANKFAEEHNLPYIETSAKEGFNIEELFDKSLDKYLIGINFKNEDKNIKLDEIQSSQGGCCS